MSSRSQAPYYYKSPTRRQDKVKDKSAKTPVGKRVASKSPSAVNNTTKHGMSPSVLGYLKLMDELKVVCGHIDETTVELKHLVETYNKREKALTTPEQKDKAGSLRLKYGIPEMVEW